MCADATGDVRAGAKVEPPEALVTFFKAFDLPLTAIAARPVHTRSGSMGVWRDTTLVETRDVNATWSAMTVTTDRRHARGMAQLMGELKGELMGELMGPAHGPSSCARLMRMVVPYANEKISEQLEEGTRPPPENPSGVDRASAWPRAKTFASPMRRYIQKCAARLDGRFVHSGSLALAGVSDTVDDGPNFANRFGAALKGWSTGMCRRFRREPTQVTPW